MRVNLILIFLFSIAFLVQPVSYSKAGIYTKVGKLVVKKSIGFIQEEGTQKAIKEMAEKYGRELSEKVMRELQQKVPEKVLQETLQNSLFVLRKFGKRETEILLRRHDFHKNVILILVRHGKAGKWALKNGGEQFLKNYKSYSQEAVEFLSKQGKLGFRLMRKYEPKFILDMKNKYGKKALFELDKISKNLKRKPNFKLAGKKKTFNGSLGKKYPEGVKIDNFGFPDFSKYAKKTVKLNKTTGNRARDFKMADKLAGIDKKYRVKNGLVWHHNQDRRTLELVPKELHSKVAHKGGIWLSKIEKKLDSKFGVDYGI